MSRKKGSRHSAVLEVAPGQWTPVRMYLDAGKPPWAVFRVYRRHTTFAIPLADLIRLGFAAAQRRYVERKLGVKNSDAA